MIDIFIFVRSPDEQMALEEMCYTVIRDLNSYGVCVLDSFLGESKGHKVLSEVKRIYSSGLFRVSLKIRRKILRKFFHVLQGRDSFSKVDSSARFSFYCQSFCKRLSLNQ